MFNSFLVAAENSGANFQEIAKLVAEKWNSLSEEDRKQYKAMAATDAERYKINRCSLFTWKCNFLENK